jgi:branched-subunit amino acid transport protein AzlD
LVQFQVARVQITLKRASDRRDFFVIFVVGCGKAVESGVVNILAVKCLFAISIRTNEDGFQVISDALGVHIFTFAF